MEIIDRLREWRLRRAREWNDRKKEELDLRKLELEGKLKLLNSLAKSMTTEAELERAKRR